MVSKKNLLTKNVFQFIKELHSLFRVIQIMQITNLIKGNACSD